MVNYDPERFSLDQLNALRLLRYRPTRVAQAVGRWRTARASGD